MPLDIFIDTNSKEDAKPLMLFIEEYDSIMEVLEKEDGFPVLKKILFDYYGESEVYLNELNALKQEAIRFKAFDAPKSVHDFINEFVGLIELAEKKTCTIKLVGD